MPGESHNVCQSLAEIISLTILVNLFSHMKFLKTDTKLLYQSNDAFPSWPFQDEDMHFIVEL